MPLVFMILYLCSLILFCIRQPKPKLIIICRHILKIGFVRKIVIDACGYVKLQILRKNGWLATGEVLGVHFPVIGHRQMMCYIV